MKERIGLRRSEKIGGRGSTNRKNKKNIKTRERERASKKRRKNAQQEE